MSQRFPRERIKRVRYIQGSPRWCTARGVEISNCNQEGSSPGAHVMGGDGSFPDEVKSMRNDVPLLPHSPPFHRRSKWGLSSQKTQNNHRAKGNHKVRERK